MILAPFQLREYVIDSFHLDVNPAFYGGSDEEISRLREPGDSIGIGFEITEYSLPTMSAPGIVRLKVEAGSFDGTQLREDTPGRYRLVASIVGKFDIAESEEESSPVDEDTLRVEFMNSALSIVYGILRATVVQMTAMSPYPKLVLPMVAFDSAIPTDLTETETTS